MLWLLHGHLGANRAEHQLSRYYSQDRHLELATSRKETVFNSNDGMASWVKLTARPLFWVRPVEALFLCRNIWRICIVVLGLWGWGKL